jgi:dephospho-CoA kinase
MPKEMNAMIRIGLTGGIAAGKSVAAARFAELGAVVIDHDQLAREVVEPGTVGLDRLVEAFGDSVLDADGRLDRLALGHLVFGNHEALATLNGVLHPEIARLAAEREAAAYAADSRVVVVHDIPLLVETSQDEAFHVLVVIDTPADLRIRRLVEVRGLALPEARQRVAVQASDEERRAAADVILSGAGSDENLRAGVDALWARLQDEVAVEAGEV